MEKKLVPELRFPGFSGEWEEKQFGSLGTFGKTYSYSRDEEGLGEYHHIHYGDIHSKFKGTVNTNTSIPSISIDKNHELVEVCDIIIADASEDYADLGKTIVINDDSERKIIAGSHTFKFTPSDKLNSVFYMNYSKCNSYRRFVGINGTGVSVLGLSKTNLSNMKLLIPSILEQEKIANFFTLIDNKLEKQEEKIINLEEYKKGMMQKIFSQEIRFKDEAGEDYCEWEDKKLGEVCDYVDYRGKTPTKVDRGIILVTAKNIKTGYIDYETSKEYVKESEYEQIMSRGLPKIGDVLITTEAPCGNVSQVDREDIALAQRVIKYRGKNNLIDNSFLKYTLISELFQRKLEKISTGGTVKGVKGSTLHKTEIFLPSSIQEQTKIANLLSSIDSKVEKEKEKLDFLKELKKGLMQKMFI